MSKPKILITGSSKGLGLAIARELNRDYCLILHASKPENIRELKDGNYVLAADFSNADELKNFCKQLKADHGDDLYGVINNAGITIDKSLIFQPESDIDRMIQVNLKAPVMICKIAMKIFNTKRRGVIINMSSCVAESGNAFQGVYAATKAGLTALSKSLAQEAGVLNEEHQIRVLSVSPGFIETDMTSVIPEVERVKYLQRIPSGRFGKPEELARLIRFLLSDEASYMNGRNIDIDGGIR